jgi:hypothetical protein
MKLILFLSSGLLLFSACKKIEGEGGSSSIKGKIHVMNYNGVGTLLGEWDGAKEDVYICYGTEDNTYDDKMEASWDGTFEFKYLENGTYTIFSYEDCASCPSGKKEVIKTVTIDKKKSTVDVGTIILNM